MKHKTIILFSNRWIMMALFVIHCSLFVQVSAWAQTFTQRLQTADKNGATVTVHHDKAIDDLVNGPRVSEVAKATATTTTSKSTASKTTASKTAASKTATPVAPVKQQDTKTEAPKVLVADSAAADSVTSKRSSHSYKSKGFRVQVYAGGNSRKDRQKAEQIGNELRALFPREAVYVHFFSPRWICRMGNYQTQEEAHRALQEVKQLGYTAATIVKGTITVQY